MAGENKKLSYKKTGSKNLEKPVRNKEHLGDIHSYSVDNEAVKKAYDEISGIYVEITEDSFDDDVAGMQQYVDGLETEQEEGE